MRASVCAQHHEWLRVSRLSRRNRILVRNVLRGGFWCGGMSIMWIILSLEVQQRRQGLFEAFFALPLLLSLAIGLCTMRAGWSGGGIDSWDSAVERRARMRFFAGVGAALVGVLCWLVGETACDDVVFFRWFPGHVVWHLCMSWGLMQALVYGTMLRANNHGATPRFVEHEVRRRAHRRCESNAARADAY